MNELNKILDFYTQEIIDLKDETKALMAEERHGMEQINAAMEKHKFLEKKKQEFYRKRREYIKDFVLENGFNALMDLFDASKLPHNLNEYDMTYFSALAIQRLERLMK